VKLVRPPVNLARVSIASFRIAPSPSSQAGDDGAHDDAIVMKNPFQRGRWPGTPLFRTGVAFWVSEA
jgi:hypothetical protein